MSNLAFVIEQLQGASEDLEADNKRAEVSRWEEIKAFLDGMRDEELRIVFGGHYDNQTRFWMGCRLIGQIATAQSEADGKPVSREDNANYLDAVTKDEARFNAMMGREGVRFAGD